MTRIFTLPRRGQVYTSPMNAHSLTPGDVIIREDAWHEITMVSAPFARDVDGQPLVRMESQCDGERRVIVTLANRPTNRVVGARSAGHIGCN